MHKAPKPPCRRKRACGKPLVIISPSRDSARAMAAQGAGKWGNAPLQIGVAIARWRDCRCADKAGGRAFPLGGTALPKRKLLTSGLNMGCLRSKAANW